MEGVPPLTTQPQPPPRDVVGRVGLFVGGWFALGVVHSAFATAATTLGGEDLDRQEKYVVGVVAAVVATVLVTIGGMTKDRAAAPLGIIAAWAASQYVAITAGLLLSTAGLVGTSLFWAVVGVALTSTLALLLWIPHPVLGVNVGITVVVAVVAAPLRGLDTTTLVGTKGLLIAFALVLVAVIVEVRTASRAGSALYYAAVVALVVGKVAGYRQLGGMAAVGLLAELAVIELLVALVMHRRSLAFSGWVTIELGLFLALRSALGLDFDRTGLGVVAIPLVALALVVQRYQEPLRLRILDGLPPRAAAVLRTL